jgi:hypothetical protein
MPTDKDELGGYDNPSDDEDPFFCLLQDDKLITKVAVDTDFMLQPVNQKFNDNDVRLVITVNVQPAISRLDMRFRSVNFR